VFTTTLFTTCRIFLQDTDAALPIVAMKRLDSHNIRPSMGMARGLLKKESDRQTPITVNPAHRIDSGASYSMPPVGTGNPSSPETVCLPTNTGNSNMGRSP